MKRTQIASATNAQTAAAAPATRSMVRGRANRVATRAPAHKPTYDANQARTGVSSQPTTTSRWASHRGTSPSALALPGQGDDGERRDRDRERAAGGDRERDAEREQPRHHGADHGRDHDGHGPAGERRLAPPGAGGGRDDPAHPREEGPEHPPDGQVPPGAPAPDRVPRPGVGDRKSVV